jgi:HK97 family phage portal protein
VSKYVEIAGSGRIKVASQASLKRARAVERVGPLEGTNVSLWNEGGQIAQFWSETFGQTLMFSPRLLERVWAANRCLQLNSQQIRSMPLRFFSNAPSARTPRWLSNPDPNWYPNGIRDALFAMTWDYYGYGDAFLYVTSFYEDGFPYSWTVLPAAAVSVKVEDGARVYTFGASSEPLNSKRVVQIPRNPRSGEMRGTSALASYAGPAWNTIAGGTLTNDLLNNLPPAVLKRNQATTKQQAEIIQNQWADRAAQRRRGVPPVLPPDIDLVATDLGFSPKDLLLLESQEFDARVIASAFGVPASLLNMAVTGGLTYQNPATLGEQWWRFELLTTAGEIAGALSAQMLPAGSEVRFDASATFSPLDTPEEGAAPLTPAAAASPAQQNGRTVVAIGGNP